MDTLEAPVSGMISWKIVLEYRLSRVKAKTGILFCLLKGSSFVIIYRITWLLR
jgi:hypothetical protein